MKVEVITTFGNQEKGSIIELNDILAKQLIKKGKVKETDEEPIKKAGRPSKKNIETK